MLGLAALYQLTERATAEPIKPELWLRALLGGLHALSNGDRQPYTDYWQCAVAPRRDGEADGAERYSRATYMRTHWNGIVRSLGMEPQRQALYGQLRQMIDQQRERSDPEMLARLEMVRRVNEAKYDREIVARKGRPSSEEGRRLMAERIARGEDPA